MVIIESHNSLIKYYPTCLYAWKLDLGRNHRFDPTISLEFTPFTKFDPSSHRIIPSFYCRVHLVDQLEAASTDFINSLSESFEVSYNKDILSVFPKLGVVTWKLQNYVERLCKDFHRDTT